MTDFEKQYVEIIDNTELDSFDSLMNGLEKLLDLVESNSSVDQELIEKAVSKAEEYKAKAAKLLKQERQDILTICEINGINPEDVGMK